jgi:hypothetical protein
VQLLNIIEVFRTIGLQIVDMVTISAAPALLLPGTMFDATCKHVFALPAVFVGRSDAVRKEGSLPPIFRIWLLPGCLHNAPGGRFQEQHP